MKYYILEPEVAGGLGVNTILDQNTHPPIVKRLHYELDGWLGDELLATFPCYIVTQQLKAKIENTGFSGVQFDTVEITKSCQFMDIYPNRNIPDFVWLKVIGRAGVDDFGITKDNRLIISARALTIMDLKYCRLSYFT
jgi:hypothetical protein